MHIPYDLCIGTERVGTFHTPCAFSSEAFAHLQQLVQTGRRLLHKFFVRACMIIGQHTLTKLINHVALFFCTCALHSQPPTSTWNTKTTQRGPQQLSWAENQWSKYTWEFSKKNSKPRSKTMALEFLRARYLKVVS